MSGRRTAAELLFYLGLLFVFAPFLKGHAVWLPLVFAALWGIAKGSGFAAENATCERLREGVVGAVRRQRGALVFLLLVAAFAFPFVASSYLLDVMTGALLYAMLASALNITVGFTGVLVLGFIGFYAIGAYTVGILTVKFALCSFWLALPAAGVMALLFGLLLGIPSLRLKGDYLAIVTLGFGEIVKIFCNNLDGLTGGPNGILGIARPTLGPVSLDSPRAFYWFCLVLLCVVVLVVARLANSRFGRAWIAVRENEMAAGALGIDVFGKPLLSFSLSAFFGGIAGALFAAKQGFISPDSFTFYESVLVLCMVVLGGIGNVAGSLVGAFLLIVLPELLREFSLYRMLIFGALMIAFMIFRPHGLVGSRTISLEVEDRPDAAA